VSEALDALLARSRAAGSPAGRRRFSLAPERAADWLRRGGLRHPDSYVLELIRAAVWSGASWIAVEASGVQTTVAWVGGRDLDPEQLGALFGHLLTDPRDEAGRALGQLARGIAGGLQRGAVGVTIDAGHAAGALRLEVEPAGGAQLGRLDGGLHGTAVRLQWPVAPWWRRWFQVGQAAEPTEEEVLIEERCAHLPVPMLLNGRAPFGWTPSPEIHAPGLHAQRRISSDPARGVIGLIPPGLSARPGIELVIGGVVLGVFALPELGLPPAALRDPRAGSGFGGVVRDDLLLRTPDQAELVHDAEYVDLLHVLQGELEMLVRGLPEGAGWRGPLLPPRANRGTAALAPVLAQLGGRPPVELRALAEATTAPVFRIDPAHAGALGPAVLPDRLPYPILVVPEGAAEALTRALGRPALPLRSPDDIAPALRQIGAAAPPTPLRLRYPGPGGAAGDPGALRDRTATLLLRAGAPPPGFGGDGALVVISGEEVAQMGPAGPPLCLRLEAPVEPLAAPGLAERLWLELPALLDDPALPRSLQGELALALLRWGAWPSEDPAAPWLPPPWEGRRSALLSAVAMRGESGILCTGEILPQDIPGDGDPPPAGRCHPLVEALSARSSSGPALPVPGPTVALRLPETPGLRAWTRSGPGAIVLWSAGGPELTRIDAPVLVLGVRPADVPAALALRSIHAALCAPARVAPGPLLPELRALIRALWPDGEIALHPVPGEAARPFRLVRRQGAHLMEVFVDHPATAAAREGRAARMGLQLRLLGELHAGRALLPELPGPTELHARLLGWRSGPAE